MSETAQPKLNIKPEFQAERVTGKFKRLITVIKEETTSKLVAGVEKHFSNRRLVPVMEEFTEGVMVYYPQGHSILVPADDMEQLTRLGVLDDPRRVDMESGEVVPDDYELSPKEIVERKTRNRPRPAAQGGLTDLLQE